MPKKCIHILRYVIYVLLLEVELNYGSNVSQDVRSKDGVNQMNVSVTTRQAGQSNKMVEAIRADTSVNVAQAAVRHNQKCLDAVGNHSEHLL